MWEDGRISEAGLVHPSWSPNGQRMVFSAPVDYKMKIFIIDVDDNDIASVMNNALEECSPAWSPKGDKIAFSGQWPLSGNWNIYAMDTGGANLEKVTNGLHDRSPSWSPDGRKIAFALGRR